MWGKRKNKEVQKASKYCKYYFGYGSNLDLNDFNRYCRERSIKGAELNVVCAAHLVDHVLKFHYYSYGRNGGAADVVKSRAKGFAVPGLLFEPNEAAWRALDMKEGHPAVYKRQGTSIVCENLVCLEEDCATYMVVPEMIKAEIQKPSEEYAGLISNGLAAEGMDMSMLNASSQNWIKPFEDEANIKHCFVYGTLRKGELREASMQSENHVGITDNVFVYGSLFDISGQFPALFPGNGTPGRINESGEKVVGELHEYSGNMHEIMTTLDNIEGYFPEITAVRCLYQRVITKVFSEANDEFVWAWTYVYNRDISECPKIESGDWVEYRKANLS